MQCVSRIVQCIAEQLVVGLIQQLLKVRQIRRAVSATFAASQERVDSFKVRHRCEASPRGRGVHHSHSRVSVTVTVTVTRRVVVSHRIKTLRIKCKAHITDPAVISIKLTFDSHN